MAVPPELRHRRPLASRLRPASDLYERVGESVVDALVDGLYDRIETDPELRPMFIKHLQHERVKQKCFWTEWMGGPANYSEPHGYSGMRSRHGHIHITPKAAGRWLAHFRTSLAETGVGDAIVSEVMDIVTPMARGLVNESAPADRAQDLRCHRTHRSRNPAKYAAKGALERLQEALAADPTVVNSPENGPKIFLAAADRGRNEILAYLLELGMDPNAPARGKHAGDFMITPLCAAMKKRKHRTAALLRDAGAVYDTFSAAYLGDLEGLTLQLGDNPELLHATDPATDVLPITLLHHALYGDHSPLVLMLLERGLKPGPAGNRLLHLAASRGHLEITSKLLEAGADCRTIGFGSWIRYPEVAELLVVAGADVNYTPTFWHSWIWRTCTGNHGKKDDPELVAAALRYGADPHARLGGKTALHYAAKAGFIGVIKVLIHAGADPNAVDAEGATVLHYTRRSGRSVDRAAVAAALREWGARP